MPNFPAADTLALFTLAGEFSMYELAKVALLYSCEDESCGDVALDAHNSDPLGNGFFELCDEVCRFLGSIWLESAILIPFVGSGALHDEAGVDLEHVGSEVRVCEDPFESRQIHLWV